MPYIDQNTIDRCTLDENVEFLADAIIGSYQDDELEGVMNYTISRLVSKVMGSGGWRYKKFNRAIGVLECVKQELYRRLIGPYEDKAIAKNGDLPEYE